MPLLYNIVLIHFIFSAISIINSQEEGTENSGVNCTVVDNVCPLKEEYLRFYLYTNEHQKDPFLINDDNILQAPFISEAPLKIIVHGYTGNKDYSPNMELRPAYFGYEVYNILTVDWGSIALESCYFETTYNVKPVGECTAKFIDSLVEQRKDIDPNDIHIIGFSLGAHVVGFVGRSLRSFTPQRITGLDPALPLFDDFFDSTYSLRKSDAVFVDAIHTNAGWKGKVNSVGHVDFYANGGTLQPGCSNNQSCNHVRSVEYFAESIASDIGFYGYYCDTLLQYMTGLCTVPESGSEGWVLLGEHVSTSSKGVYYFQTNEKAPFAVGMTEVRRRRRTESSNLFQKFMDAYRRKRLIGG